MRNACAEYGPNTCTIIFATEPPGYVVPPCPPEVGVCVTGGTGVFVGGGVLTAAILPKGAWIDVVVWVDVGMQV